MQMELLSITQSLREHMILITWVDYVYSGNDIRELIEYLIDDHIIYLIY